MYCEFNIIKCPRPLSDSNEKHLPYLISVVFSIIEGNYY